MLQNIILVIVTFVSMGKVLLGLAINLLWMVLCGVGTSRIIRLVIIYLKKMTIWGFFAIISISFIVIGNTFTSASFLFYIGIGILLYGIFYFIFHEIVVHKRIKNKFKTQNKYLKRIIKAHHIHHKTFTQKGAEAFGFLYAQKKFESKN